MHDLAKMRRDSGDHDEAQSLFEEAQRIFDDKLGATHPYAITNLREHAKSLRAAGDDAAARRLEQQAETRAAGETGD